MSIGSLTLISLAVALAAFIQGTTGVGFALIVAPVIELMAPGMLPVCVLVLMLPLNLYVLWRERSAIDGNGSAWITAGRVAGTAGGLWVLAALSAPHLSLLVGLATMAAALVTLMMPAFVPNRQALLAAGLVTGVTETATGIGGPPLALVYQHHPAPVMRSTIALCFLVGELVSLATLLAFDRIHQPQLTAALQLLPALAIGALVSRFVHQRVSGLWLRRFVLVFAIVSGIVLMVRAL